MLSCKEVTDLASRALDAPLDWHQRFGMRLHLLFCRLCRRYVRHLRFLDRAFKRARNGNLQCRSARGKLSEKARERMRRALEKNQSLRDRER
jgi:hypothetical protein